MASSPVTLWQKMGKKTETVTDYFLGLQKSLRIVMAAMQLKDTCSFKESYDKPRQCIQKQRHQFADKGQYS